jgi:hypothetical protein
LENVLKSAKAEGMLDDVINEDAEGGGSDEDQEVGAPDAALADLLSDGPAEVNVLDEVDLAEFSAPKDSAMETASEEVKKVELDEPSKKKSPPKRRSQRQMEREIKEEAERIRQENQVSINYLSFCSLSFFEEFDDDDHHHHHLTALLLLFLKEP